MKKFITLVLTLFISLTSLFACNNENEINVYAPDGAPALSLSYAIKSEIENVSFNIISADKIASVVSGNEKKADISLCAGYGCDESYVFATDKKTGYEVIDHRSDGRSAYLKVKNVFESGKTVFTDYGLDESGLNVTVTGENEVAYMLPVFDYDGENYTNVTVSENKLTVEYEGYVCVYKTDGVIADLNAKGGNRNGHYRAFCAKGSEKLTVKIEIIKI